MKRRKPMKAITMIELGFAGILIVLLVLLVYWYSDGLASYSPKAVTYQCYGGNTFNYSDDVKFRESNKELFIETSTGGSEVPNYPILFEGSTDMTLSKNMLYMNPREEESLARLNRFTRVVQNGDDAIFQSGKKSARRHAGFLYDGKDMYIFLEPVTMQVGNSIYNLPAMSYAVVIYGESVEYYDSIAKTNELITISEMPVIVEAESGYSLNISYDVEIAPEGEAILYSAVDKINVMEMD